MNKRNIKTVLITFIFMLSMIFLSCLQSFAEVNPVKPVIRVGYFPDYGTILQPQTEDRMGYGYDYLQEIAKYTGWEYEFVKCTWNEGIELLKNGDIDIFGPMQKTEERELIFDFPDMQMGSEYGVLFADKGTALAYEDLEAFDGMKVGTEEKNYYTGVMDEYCRKNGISVEYVYTDTEDIGQELRAGKYDTYVTGDLQAIPNTTVVARLSFEPFYYAVTKGNQELLDGINYGLKEILTSDKYFEKKLYDKYFGHRDISKPKITKAELDSIQKYQPFKVACSSDSKPLQYFDDRENEFSGICVDIMKELGAICGMELEFVPLENEGRPISHEIVRDVDLIIGRHTHELLESSARYTDSYLTLPMVIVSKKSVNLSDKLNLALYCIDETCEERVRNEYPHFNIVSCNYLDEAEALLDEEKVEGIITSSYNAENLIIENNEEFNMSNTDVRAYMQICVGERMPDEIVTALNKSIGQLDNDVINTIVYKNTNQNNYNTSLAKIIKENAGLIIVVLTVLFAMVILIIEKSNRVLKTVIYEDPVTRGPSLVKFKLDAEEVLKSAMPNEYIFVSVDVNNFKYINDIYGYETGNKILCMMSDFIANIIPGETISVARNSADNFVFISKSEHKDAIIKALESEEGLIEGVKNLLGADYNLTLSIGIYQVKDPGRGLTVMLDYAGIARKTIKGRVGNLVAEYTDEMDNGMELKKKITISMEAALQHGEFITCMQPKYKLEDESLVGAEVLARWNHPEMGMMSPLLFIPLFEENGFIEKLDLYMFEATCDMIRRWQDKVNGPIPRISVNISRITLNRDNLVEELKEKAEKYGVDPRTLEIEITEGVIESNTEKIVKIINDLKAVGFYVSIDDFGSGYSSLSVLKDISADIIKIDKEFLSETFDSMKGKKIINSVIKMSKELKLETIAEGIETEEQAKELKAMGCDVAQGYYFSRPISPEDFEKLIKRKS